ncbi:YwqI/YxiC family protein [Solibacillus isronensis]|uniref:YwqI/YxiC family protein n=1 Tax=Solibacillus isronensis TaxID=412383 RepID=UPI0039A3BCCE
MSNEVKVVYADVEEQLGVMESAASTLKPAAEPPIEGNTLEVVTKLNELSLQLEQILTSYQAVLQNNIQTTETSVQYLKEQDQRISTTINGAASSHGRLME